MLRAARVPRPQALHRRQHALHGAVPEPLLVATARRHGGRQRADRALVQVVAARVAVVVHEHVHQNLRVGTRARGSRGAPRASPWHPPPPRRRRARDPRAARAPCAGRAARPPACTRAWRDTRLVNAARPATPSPRWPGRRATAGAEARFVPPAKNPRPRPPRPPRRPTPNVAVSLNGASRTSHALLPGPSRSCRSKSRETARVRAARVPAAINAAARGTPSPSPRTVRAATPPRRARGGASPPRAPFPHPSPAAALAQREQDQQSVRFARGQEASGAFPSRRRMPTRCRNAVNDVNPARRAGTRRR